MQNKRVVLRVVFSISSSGECWCCLPAGVDIAMLVNGPRHAAMNCNGRDADNKQP